MERTNLVSSLIFAVDSSQKFSIIPNSETMVKGQIKEWNFDILLPEKK
jgi:hypothetical protein